MPKVTPINVFKGTRPNGARFDGGIQFQREFECRVYANGEFRTFLTQEEATEIQAAVEGLSVHHDHKAEKHYVSTKTRDAAVNAMNAYGEWKIRAEETVELFIYYKRESTAVFCRGANGAIYRNGYHAGEGYKWADDTRDFRSQPAKTFASGLGASIRAKVTLTSPDGATSVSYRPPHEGEIGPEGKRLDEWLVSVSPTDTFRNRENEDLFMPYTEERAKWFADALQELCERADRLENSFDDLASKIDAGVASI